MSIELSQKDIGSPSTPIPIVVSGTPFMPSTTMIVALEVPIITPIQPGVANKPIDMNPFWSIFGTLRYNTQSIPSVSNPFSFGMSNMTSHIFYSILVNNANPSIRLGGMSPLHIPLLFGGTHIPQRIHMVGIQPPFHPGSNPSLNAPRWSNQSSVKVDAYVPSFTPTSSTPIPTNTFGMTNPPLSSGFPLGGGQFHTLGNPQPGATLAGGNIYNLHYKIPTGMVPNQPLMNMFVGGFYNPGQGNGAYQNLGWDTILQHQSFPGAWDQMPQP
jgi:hypothetical protein